MGNDFGPLMDNFDTIFNLVWGLGIVIFMVVIGLFIANIVKGARQGLKNNAAPEVTAQARIVDKRIQRSEGGSFESPRVTTNAFGSETTSVYEDHFVTFEQSSGERFELKVPSAEYGLLVVGDQGAVTMKGTRYLGFQRELMR